MATNDNGTIHVWDLGKIRQQLAKMDLDWNLPSYPPASEVAGTLRVPLLPEVKVDLGDLARPAPDRQEITRQLIEQERRALKANPNSAKACNALAWTYLTAPEALRDWKAALPLAEKAVELDPQSMYRNTLGLAYYRAGRYPEAVKVFEANLKDQVDWALTYDLYFLAMSQHQLGDSARAKQFYDLAVRWSASHKESLAFYVVELAAVHAEAEGVLGLRQPAQPKDKKPAPGKK